MAKPSVLVVGGTGQTGRVIVDSLLESKKFHVVIGVRPVSVDKPDVSELKAHGVEVRPIDLSSFTDAQLDEVVTGIDVVISTVYFADVVRQKPLIDAAKRAGVQRFIPDDWGTACVPGVRSMFDMKGEIQQYIKDKNLGYTFIDVGVWMEVLIPADGAKPGYPEVPAFPRTSHTLFGTGDASTALIDRVDIGKFVARIIDDPRTLNQYVFCYGDHKSLSDMWETARKVNKELGKTLNAEPKPVSEADMLEAIKTPHQHLSEYFYSMYVRGDNTVENAKKPEYGSALDARELYPDINVKDFEAFAKWFYKL